ncbi:unnamed protein product, partial [Prunus brigantina]
MGSVNTPATPTTRATSQAYPTVCFGPGYILTSPHGLTVKPGVKLPTLGQTGPRGPRPPNSNPTVSMSATWFGTLILQVWSRSDGRIAHDRMVTKTLTLGLAFPEYPGLRFTIHQHIIISGPSNGPNLANPENTRYAISVRDSNGIQIEIRAHLRAHDIKRITLGQKCPSATVPTRHHTRYRIAG